MHNKGIEGLHPEARGFGRVAAAKKGAVFQLGKETTRQGKVVSRGLQEG